MSRSRIPSSAIQNPLPGGSVGELRLNSRCWHRSRVCCVTDRLRQSTPHSRAFDTVHTARDDGDGNRQSEVFGVRPFSAGVLLSLGLFAGCAAAPLPPATLGAPAAADNGQPKMVAALNALQRAEASLQRAAPNKGGHR